MSLTAEQILAADDMGLKKVTVPEWGGDVFIRVMSVGERDEYERMWIGQKDKGIDNFRTKWGGTLYSINHCLGTLSSHFP